MVEVMIIVSIITITVLAMLGVADRSIFVARKTTHVAQATFLLEEGVEIVKILRDNNWTNISGLTTDTDYYPIFSSGSWSLSSTPSSVGIFTRTINVQDVNRDAISGDISTTGNNDVGTRLVTVTVSWQEGGDTASRTLSFYIVDIFS